ncbi:hypothetical protein Hanom_Chr16g01520511 [Helianthus anomalus]
MFFCKDINISLFVPLQGLVNMFSTHSCRLFKIKGLLCCSCCHMLDERVQGCIMITFYIFIVISVVKILLTKIFSLS